MLDSIKACIRSFLGCQEIDIDILKREMVEEFKEYIKVNTQLAALEAYETKIYRYWSKEEPPANAPLVKKLIEEDVKICTARTIDALTREYQSEVFIDKVVERIRNKQVN